MSQRIENIQFKRNKTIYQSLAELVTAVKSQDFLTKPEIAAMGDGELIMFRYKDTTGNIATLMGCIYNPDASTKEIHLEMATEEIKKIVKENVDAATAKLKPKVDPNDKVLNVDNDGNLVSIISISRDDKVVKLTGKNNGIISQFDLPATNITKDAISLKYIPEEAKLQLLGTDKSVIGEVDFPFETMVTASELTADNKLKLTFNTSNGPQEVIVPMDKLKDVYEAADKSIEIAANKVGVNLSKTQSTLPITLAADGLKVEDAKVVAVETDLNDLKNDLKKVDLGTF